MKYIKLMCPIHSGYRNTTEEVFMGDQNTNERSSLFFQLTITVFLVCILVISGCGNLSQDSDSLIDSVALVLPTATPFGTKDFTLVYDQERSNYFRIVAIPFSNTIPNESNFIVNSEDQEGTLDDSGRRNIRIRIDSNVKYLIKFYETKWEFDNDQPIDTTEFINTVVE